MPTTTHQSPQPNHPLFLTHLQSQKSRLTYQVLTDLSTPQPQHPSQQHLTQRKKYEESILKLYVDSINKIDRIYVQVRTKHAKQETIGRKQCLEELQEQDAKARLGELLDEQTKLGEHLQLAITKAKTYLETLCLRVKHEKYLNDEDSICQYLEQQKRSVQDRRKDIEKIIVKRNQDVMKMVNVAKKVCDEKEREIGERKQEEKDTRERVIEIREEIQGLVREEAEAYERISEVTEQMLRIRGQMRAKARHSPLSHDAAQSHLFSAHNTCSAIMPDPLSQPPSAILQPGSSSTSTTSLPTTTTKCQILTQTFQAEMYEKKAYFLVLLILGVMLYFW